jgi:8-oxo-dGTP pyrophosphatase MutT (NUDIX family)
MMLVNVEVAVVRDGRYLAIERGSGEDFGAGWLGFPGGKLDPDAPLADALEETARREVLEEVGLMLDGIHYVESHTFCIDEIVVLDVVMLAQSTSGEPYPASPDEVSSVAWLTAGELTHDPRTQEWTRESLALAETKRVALGW